MADKYVELFGPTPVDTDAETVFTNTSGIVTVVDFFSVANPSVSAIVVRVSIGSDAAGTRVFEHTCPAGETSFFYPRWVLTSTDTLQLSATSADDTAIAYASGRQRVA